MQRTFGPQILYYSSDFSTNWRLLTEICLRHLVPRGTLRLTAVSTPLRIPENQDLVVTDTVVTTFPEDGEAHQDAMNECQPPHVRYAIGVHLRYRL